VWTQLNEILHHGPDELTVQSGIQTGSDGGPTVFLSPVWSGDLSLGQTVVEILAAWDPDDDKTPHWAWADSVSTNLAASPTTPRSRTPTDPTPVGYSRRRADTTPTTSSRPSRYHPTPHRREQPTKGFRMKKSAWSFAAGAVALVFLSACASSTPVAQERLDQIVTQGTVRVCSTGDYRPFTHRDPQGWSGLDVEMAQDLAKNLAVKLDVVQTTWATMAGDLGTKCDMAMGGISITLDRAKHALYSIPYLRDGKAAAIRCADRSKYETLADIDQPGVRVVVNPGGTNAEFDNANLHHATIVNYPDNNTIFDQVSGNNTDVMITDASEIRWQIKQNPNLCGSSIDHPFTFEQKAYLIPRSDAALQQWVNEWLNIAQNDGTYARIAKKWLGDVGQP
jgi:cyclohexadienyl dehydratase